MADIANQFSKAYAKFTGLHNEILQAFPIVLDILDSMAGNDTTTFVMPSLGDPFLPPRVTVLRHTGGDVTNSSPAGTYVDSNGDTLVFAIDDGAGNNRPDGTPFAGAVIPQYTHSLVGLTAGAATAVQIAASINGDPQFKGLIRAAAGLTTNAVTIAPVSPRGSVQVVGGTATGIVFPSTVGDAKKRTYVSQSIVITGGTGFSFSYNAGTKTLVVKNETGGAVNRTVVVIH